MLHTALWNAKTVMQELLPTLLSKPGASQVISLNVNEEQALSSDVVHVKLLDLVENEEVVLVLYNALTRPRHEVCIETGGQSSNRTLPDHGHPYKYPKNRNRE